jgi:hypothetical protein
MMANTHQTQEGLIESLQLDRARFQHITNNVSAVEQEKPFSPEGWSIKDFLAHMAHWKNAAHAVLVAYTHDQPLPPVVPSGDEPNAERRVAYSPLSLTEAKAFWEETHQQLIDLIGDELEDARLNEEVRAPWSEEDTLTTCDLVTDMCGHDAEHMDFIEKYFTIPE